MAEVTPAHIRFWAKVDKSDDQSCWLWLGSLNAKGYGSFHQGPGLGSTTAHRWAWSSAKGDIPDGWQVDHLCKVRHCVNPNHLEAVTARENNRRSDSMSARRAKQTHCKDGHPLSGDNLLVEKNGRRCKACRKKALKNVDTKTCPNGHEYTAANTRIRPNGRRVCRKCHNARHMRWKNRKRAVA